MKPSSVLMGWIVCNEKGIGCLGNLECLMRRADDVKLQERLEGGGHGRPDVSKSHIDTSAGIGRPTAGFSNQRALELLLRPLYQPRPPP